MEVVFTTKSQVKDIIFTWSVLFLPLILIMQVVILISTLKS